MKERECDSFACAHRPVRQTGFLLYKYNKQVFYFTKSANRFSANRYRCIFVLLFGRYSRQLDDNKNKNNNNNNNNNDNNNNNTYLSFFYIGHCFHQIIKTSRFVLYKTVFMICFCNIDRTLRAL